MGNLFKWLKDWWDNTKGVVLDWVFPKLDDFKPVIAQFIRENQKKIVDAVNNFSPDDNADKVIEEIKEYLKRQL